MWGSVEEEEWERSLQRQFGTSCVVNHKLSFPILDRLNSGLLKARTEDLLCGVLHTVVIAHWGGPCVVEQEGQ